jgi:DNA-directed RNA polymerase specialized sigma24 family protein
MQRSSYWHERLNRWALWVFTAPGGSRPSIYLERVDCAVQWGTLTPEINDEAILTDQAVAALPPQLKAAVRASYLDGIGNSRAGIACRLHISERTLHNRLCHADLRLDQWHEARDAKAQGARRSLAPMPR